MNLRTEQTLQERFDVEGVNLPVSVRVTRTRIARRRIGIEQQIKERFYVEGVHLLVTVHVARLAAHGAKVVDIHVAVAIHVKQFTPRRHIARSGAGQASDRGNWVRFRVIDEHGRDALGATVTLSLRDRNIRRDVQPAYSYLGANDPRVHVGLGERTQVGGVEVRWPDGVRESFGEFEAGQTVVLERGKGSGVKAGG